MTRADPHELQRKANKFRQGYKNWRQKKPFGARGEATDLKEQKEEPIEIVDTGEEGGLPRLHHARTISVSKEHKAKDKEVNHDFHSTGTGMLSVPPASPGAEVVVQPDGEKPASGLATRRNKSFSVSLTAQEMSVEQEENWLKFYVNPFAELPDKKAEPLPLSTQNLGAILETNFKSVRGKGPSYDRTPGKPYSRICHVGVGGFHRSHQAVYTDDLLELTGGKAAATPETDRWGICGVGLMVWDKKMYEALKGQDHMYTVLFRSQVGNDARVVGSIFDFVFAPEDYNALFATLNDAATKIVSLTITEKGYCQKVDGNLNTDDPNVKHDVSDPTLSTPRTAMGMICGALDRRRKAGQKSFTVLSCDNQPDNGHQLEKLVKQMAELAVGPELRAWIEENTTFPNTMVDRITPVTEQVHKDVLEQDFGVVDEWPVVAEHYGQWIVEDKFVDGRPRWEDVGVMFVPDVKPYEYMKLRLLNGTHSALSYVSHLSGFQFVDDALNNDQVRKFVNPPSHSNAYQPTFPTTQLPTNPFIYPPTPNQVRDFVECYMEEVCQSVPHVPGVDLEQYKKDLIARFSNPYVKDKVERLMLDGSQKLRNTMRYVSFLSFLLYPPTHPPTCFLTSEFIYSPNTYVCACLSLRLSSQPTQLNPPPQRRHQLFDGRRAAHDLLGGGRGRVHSVRHGHRQ